MAVIVRYDAVPIGTIKDLEREHDLTLVDTSQDLEEIAEYLGKPRWFRDFGGCFVKIEDGEYKEIYCYEGNTPTLNKDVYKIIPIAKPDVGDKVKLRPDVLVRHARRIPPYAGFTKEQFRWREILSQHKDDVGVVTRTFPNSKYVNIDFPDGTLIGIDYTELELVDD